MVEPLGFSFHQFGLGSCLFQVQRAQEPDRLAFQEALYVLATDHRNVVAELLAIEIEQAMAVAILLLRHGGKHPSCPGICLTHGFREIIVGAAVLLLECNGKRQQFLLR